MTVVDKLRLAVCMVCSTCQTTFVPIPNLKVDLVELLWQCYWTVLSIRYDLLHLTWILVSLVSSALICELLSGLLDGNRLGKIGVRLGVHTFLSSLWGFPSHRVALTHNAGRLFAIWRVLAIGALIEWHSGVLLGRNRPAMISRGLLLYHLDLEGTTMGAFARSTKAPPLLLRHVIGRGVCCCHLNTDRRCILEWLHDGILTGPCTYNGRGPGLISRRLNWGQTQYVHLDLRFTRVLCRSDAHMATIVALHTRLMLLRVIGLFDIDHCCFLNVIGIVERTNFWWGSGATSSVLDSNVLIVTLVLLRSNARTACETLDVTISMLVIGILDLT